MTTGKYVAYYRVSTDRQGQSGLGLDAQRKAVLDHLNGGTLLDSFTEVESGRRNDRPELAKALGQCRAGIIAAGEAPRQDLHRQDREGF